MRCYKCGVEIPNDSDFCPYCGGKIEKDEAEEYTKLKSCIEQSKEVDLEEKGRERKPRVGVLLTILCFILLAFGVFEYTQVQKGNETIRELCNEVSSRDEKIKSQVDQMQLINTLNEKLSDTSAKLSTSNGKVESLQKELIQSHLLESIYENDSNNYNEVVKFGKKGGFGTQSENFYAGENLIILQKGSSPQTITITARFNSQVSLTLEQTGYSVIADFTESEWYGDTTTILISPLSEGVSMVEITNSINSKTIRILVIVT